LGWFFVLATSGITALLVGLVSLVMGVIGFLVWSRFTGRWPFVIPTGAGEPVIADTTRRRGNESMTTGRRQLTDAS
ncbi:MAG: hypothetical protein LC799_17230, partial [Actinobacteria bacterium]|nr:hypothetical protein [Actinomycetota bacterium]